MECLNTTATAITVTARADALCSATAIRRSLPPGHLPSRLLTSLVAPSVQEEPQPFALAAGGHRGLPSRPHQGAVPRAVTQLWRPPAVGALPPPGSPPAARAEAQNGTELQGPEGLTAQGQGQGSPRRGPCSQAGQEASEGPGWHGVPRAWVTPGAPGCDVQWRRGPEGSSPFPHLLITSPWFSKVRKGAHCPQDTRVPVRPPQQGASSSQGLPSTRQHARGSSHREPLTALLCWGEGPRCQPSPAPRCSMGDSLCPFPMHKPFNEGAATQPGLNCEGREEA